MTAIKPYTTWVRTFGCTNGLEVEGKIAHEVGLKVAVGAWISTDLDGNEKEISSLINIGKGWPSRHANCGQRSLAKRAT